MKILSNIQFFHDCTGRSTVWTGPHWVLLGWVTVGRRANCRCMQLASLVNSA